MNRKFNDEHDRIWSEEDHFTKKRFFFSENLQFVSLIDFAEKIIL